MGSLLRECENLVSNGWDEVKVDLTKLNATVGAVGSHDSAINRYLDSMIREIAYTDREYNYNLDSYDELKWIIGVKMGIHSGNKWITCQARFESLRMLLNSKYSTANFINLGRAKDLFNKAVPLYARLSGLDAKNLELTKRSTKDSRKNAIKDVLNQLSKECDGIRIAVEQGTYEMCMRNAGAVDVFPVAFKGDYVIHLVNTSMRPCECLKLEYPYYGLAVYNAKTHRYLKVNTYSDIKRILNKVGITV